MLLLAMIFLASGCAESGEQNDAEYFTAEEEASWSIVRTRVPELNGFIITAEQDVYKKGEIEITYTYKNATVERLFWLQSHAGSVEKLVGGVWKRVPGSVGSAIPGGVTYKGPDVEIGQTGTSSYYVRTMQLNKSNWHGCHDKNISPGEYRASVGSFYYWDECDGGVLDPAEEQCYTAYVYFTVK